MKIICPRCDQSYVNKMEIIPLKRIVFLCDECDALWEVDTPILKMNYTDFGDYMSQFGYAGDWSLVRNVSESDT